MECSDLATYCAGHEKHLEDVLLLIILGEQDLVHNRGLPFGPLVGHGGGLVHVVRQAVARAHGHHVLGVGGAHFVDEDLTILNGLTHRTQAISIQQLVLGLLLQGTMVFKLVSCFQNAVALSVDR